jgi:hypothetical protein
MLEQTDNHYCGCLGPQDASAQRHNYPAALAGVVNLFIGPATFRTNRSDYLSRLLRKAFCLLNQ